VTLHDADRGRRTLAAVRRSAFARWRDVLVDLGFRRRRAILGLAVAVCAGACGPSDSELTIHNRTTGPVVFQTFPDSEREYLAGCESVTYKWSGSWKRTDPPKQPAVDVPDATQFEVTVWQPPDGSIVATVVVTLSGTDYFTSDPTPLLPACQGLAPTS
jgi:hypothetical protein